jgi:hypothetical protein
MLINCEFCKTPLKFHILTEPDEELEIEVEPCPACMEERYRDGRTYWRDIHG